MLSDGSDAMERSTSVYIILSSLAIAPTVETSVERQVGEVSNAPSSSQDLKKALGGRSVTIGLLLSNDPKLQTACDKLWRAGAHSELLAEYTVLVCDRAPKLVLGDCPHSLNRNESLVHDAYPQHGDHEKEPTLGAPTAGAVSCASKTDLAIAHRSFLPFDSFGLASIQRGNIPVCAVNPIHEKAL
jgi:hypothetical protein